MSELYDIETRYPENQSKSRRELRAGGSCRGICPRYAVTTKWGQKKYEMGLQFCSYCNKWFHHPDRLCCICCGKRLRYKRRNKNNRYHHSKKEINK